jgi:SAM-dependent methyltransferase
MSGKDWDARYEPPGYRYGTEPNEFLREVAKRIPRGPVLCLADGEGRNGVHLAGLRHHVLSVDFSRTALGKARRLATANRVGLATLVADLEAFEIAPGAWSGIVSIWAHTPPETRRRIHRAAVAGLAPGGAFVLEAYTPAQLARGTGGPSDAARMMTLAGLREELAGLEFVIGRELVRRIDEGELHHGESEVVQVLAFKPAAG